MKPVTFTLLPMEKWMNSYTEQMVEMIDSELKPIIAERDHYFDRCEKLEAALQKHHTGIGCVNYCRTCGGHFSWEDPKVSVSFPPSGEAK